MMERRIFEGYLKRVVCSLTDECMPCLKVPLVGSKGRSLLGGRSRISWGEHLVKGIHVSDVTGSVVMRVYDVH